MKPIIMEMTVRIQILSTRKRGRAERKQYQGLCRDFSSPNAPMHTNASAEPYPPDQRKEIGSASISSLEMYSAFSYRIKHLLCSHIHSPEASQASSSPYPKKWGEHAGENAKSGFSPLLVASLL